MRAYWAICIITGLGILFPINVFGDFDSSDIKWDISQLEEIPVVILRDTALPSKTIENVKEVIFSELSYNIDGVVSFFGWNGIIDNMNYWGDDFSFPKLTILKSDDRRNTITIFLTSKIDPNGSDGTTQLILDENEIAGADITIYQAHKLTKSQITNIVRHEIGHALGFQHSPNPNELMYELIIPDKFLTAHDGYHLVELYMT